MNKYIFIIYGPSNSDNTTFTKDFCYLYETVNVFCIEMREWRGCNAYGSNDLDLLDNTSNLANSLIIFDDMGENIRLPILDSLNSTGRRHNIDISGVGHTVPDLNTKTRENTPMVYIILNGSQQFFERVQEKFKIDSNLYRFKHHKYGIIKYDPINDFYIVFDKNKNVVYDSRVNDLVIERCFEYKEFTDSDFNILSTFLTDRLIEPTYIKHNELMFFNNKF